MGIRKDNEKYLNHETLPSLTNDPAPINLHLYQPPRILRISHANKNTAVFDISGTSRSDPGFNHRITTESYEPLIRQGILSHKLISWNLYGVTADWLETYRPELIHVLQDQIQEGAKPPVGDTYLHNIFPFLGQEHKDMLLTISKQVYRQRWGGEMESVWLPESGVDSKSLEVLRRNGILSVHLREHQVYSDIGSNTYQLSTKEGKILAIVGHNHLSGMVGFAKPWSDTFYHHWQEASHRLGYSPRLSVDGETLGHWWKANEGVFDFAKYLLKHLERGLKSQDMKFSMPQIPPPAKLIENTSWSCFDSGLGRWKGSDNCSCELPQDYHQAYAVRNSKRDLFEKLSLANTMLDSTLDQYLPGWRDLYVEWFISQRHNLASGLPIITSDLKDKTLEKLFLSAYIRDLGWTSCGWFFGDINGFERQIPANSLKAIAEIMHWPELKPVY